MVWSSSSSPRPDPPVVADAASGDLDPAPAIMHWHLGARSRSRHQLAAVPAPRALMQNRADNSVTPLAAAAAASSASSSSRRNNATSTSSASAGSRTTLNAVSTPLSATSIQPPGTRPITSNFTPVSATSTQSPGAGAVRAPVPRTVPVAAITCAAVGGAVVLAAILALIYILRIRRRVKRMKRCTDILGPELAPVLSPRLSHLTVDSRVKPDLASSPTTASPTKHLLPPLSAPASSRHSRHSVEQQHINGPLYPTRRSVVVLSLPPAPRRTSALSPTPRSPIRSSAHTSRSIYGPHHDHERGTTTTTTHDSSHS